MRKPTTEESRRELSHPSDSDWSHDRSKLQPYMRPEQLRYAIENTADELWKKVQSLGVDTLTQGCIPPGILVEGLRSIFRLPPDFGYSQIVALRTIPDNNFPNYHEIVGILDALLPDGNATSVLETLAHDLFVEITPDGTVIRKLRKAEEFLEAASAFERAYLVLAAQNL